jgi:tRNA (guanosine-2'-O-)-methyltransferase
MRSNPTASFKAGLLTPGRPALPPGWTTDGVVAVLEPLVEERRSVRLSSVAGERIGSVTLLMDAPQDPHNAAAALRSADAFGLPELHVVPRAEPFELGRKVSQGAERWVEVVLHDSAESAVQTLRARGYTLVSTHPQGTLTPEDLPKLERLCLVVGNETDGISHALTNAAETSVRVPMRGFVESLNLSVAAALLLRAATLGRTGDLSPEERRRLYAAYLVRSVPRAGEVLAALGPR